MFVVSGYDNSVQVFYVVIHISNCNRAAHLYDQCLRFEKLIK